MKILLLTDIPPCHQYTAGLVLNRLVHFLPLDRIALCAVINSEISPEIPLTLDKIPKFILKKPKESSLRIFPSFLANISAYLFEFRQELYVKHKLLPQIAAFAKQQQVDTLWVVLQGQTMVRLAKSLSQILSIPLFTQIWDPFEWWLRANRIDKLTQRRLLIMFDKTIAHSTSCATASWAMSEAYTKNYGIKNQPVIAGLPKELAKVPATSPHSSEEFIIGMAGQFYAESEWHCLICTLNEANWIIANRRIRVRVLGSCFQSFTQKPANFEYLGWQSQEDTIRLLAECDLLYLPYWFSEEFRREATYSFPSKLVSYFAAGRPVLCHAPAYSSPAKYLVENDAGYLCESLDPPAIFKILEKVIIDKDAYERIAKNGAACFLRDFTLERMCDSFFQFLAYNTEPSRTLLSNTKLTASLEGNSKWEPKVSIIIPVYNGSNYLKEAIESALSQTYNNIEIIVVNDGSNDNGATETIALSYGDKVRYFSKPNGGVASSLNLAISQMRGEYFSWLSHDDLYVKEKIEHQINVLSKMNSDKVVLYSNYSIFTNNPNKDIACQLKGVPSSMFRYWLTVENSLQGCTLLIPKSAFVECGGFDENLRTTQDYDLWFRMATKYQFTHLPISLVKARSHKEQGSVTMRKIALKECNELLSKFVKQLSMIEIQEAAYCSGGLGYAQIASNMRYRGFFATSRTAALLSIKHSFNSPLREVVLAQCILMKGVLMYALINPMRRIFSPYLRLTIKKFLKSIVKNPAKPQILNEPLVEAQQSPPLRTSYEALEDLSLSEKFSVIYEQNLFKGRASRSGEGSDLVQTAIIRQEIPKLLDEFNIHSMLDAPCGDWFWMQHTKFNILQYIGVDIVKALIKKNQQTYGNSNTWFKYANLVTDLLPKVDLIFSRDCLVHLSNDDALSIIKNFKNSGAQYFLTTTFVGLTHNIDLGDTFWRPLNMQLAPFHFPAPLKLINEGCTERNNMFTDKSLGLWRLEDLLI